MTDKQLQIIVGLIAGMQTAIVHLSNTLSTQTGMDKNALAESFDKTAEAIPETVNNREMLQTVLLQISKGIKSSGHSDDFEKSLLKILH